MTKSVYIIGGAGTGKSTFTAELLNRLGAAIANPTAGAPSSRSEGTR